MSQINGGRIKQNQAGYQLTLALDAPHIRLRPGDKVLVLFGKKEGRVGTVSVPARPSFTLSIVTFPGRNSLGSYTRDQLFILKRKYKSEPFYYD